MPVLSWLRKQLSARGSMGSGASKTATPTHTGDEELARLRDWRGKLHFKDLDDLGISAFRQFLSPHDSRRLDFWCNGPTLDSEDLRSYVTDGPDMVKDATDDAEFKDSILLKADEVSAYITGLRSSMEPDLLSEFNRFQKTLDERINALEQARK